MIKREKQSIYIWLYYINNRVILECGYEDKIHSVRETTTCVYEIVLKTPCECSDELLNKLINH